MTRLATFTGRHLLANGQLDLQARYFRVALGRRAVGSRQIGKDMALGFMCTIVVVVMMVWVGIGVYERERRRLEATADELLCSGYGENEEAQSLISMGAVGLLSKPYRIGELSELPARFRR